MALSEKISFRKFHCTFRNHRINMAPADIMCWEGVTVSCRTDANGEFTAEREAVLEFYKAARKIDIEYLDVFAQHERTFFIRLQSIEETASPAPDIYMLRLHNGEEMKFRFGGPATKAAFVEAITISSSDSGNSSEDSNG